MSDTIPTELHEEIVTELQYKLEELEREVDDLNEEIEDSFATIYYFARR